MRLSVRSKVVLFAVLPVVAIYTGFMLFNVLEMRRLTVASVEWRLGELAGNGARHFDSHLREAAQIAAMTAAFIENRPQLTSDELYTQLQTNLEMNPLVYASGICFEPYQYDPNQRFVMRYAYRNGEALRLSDPSRTGYDYTDEKQEYWHVPRTTGRPVWTKPYYDEGAGDILMSTYSVPFFRDGEFWGIATVDIPLEPLRELADVRMPEHFEFTIITCDGTYVFSPLPDRINKSVSEMLSQGDGDERVELARAIAAGQTGSKKVTGWVAGEREWVAHAPIESARWGFAASVPERTALAPVQEQFARDVIALGASLVLILAGLWFLSAQISGPITRLVGAVTSFAAGDTTARAQKASDDEIGLLAENFNDMAGRVAQREKELRESEERSRAILDTVPDLMFCLTRDGVHLAFHDAKRAEICTRPDEIHGRTVGEILPEPVAEAYLRHIARAIDGGEVEVFEYYLECSETDRRHFEARMVSYRDDEVLTIVRDITERRRAEEQLRRSEGILTAAQKLAHVGSWDWDVQSGDVDWSDETYRIFGLHPGHFRPHIDSVMALFHTDDRAKHEELIEHAIADKSSISFDARILRPDGTVREVVSSAQGQYDEEDRLTRIVGTVHDITERKRAEKDRRELEAQLRQSQKLEAIGQLAGGVAHDFNNILTAILGHVELSIDTVRGELGADHGAVQSMVQIEQAAQRASALTRQLLTFSRRDVMRPQALNLNTILTGLDRMLQRLITEDIVLDTATDPELALVQADAGHLEQVVVNLVVNAVHAMPDGGRLTLETQNVTLDEAYTTSHAEARPGPHVLLAVSDTGHGMDAATLERVFEPFFTTKAVDKGTGLGLATVHGIVKQTGGHIMVYSEPARGTTFKVYLPAIGTIPDDESPLSEPDAYYRGHETIMLCEDDRPVRELIAESLRSAGYTVLTAGNGKKGLEVAQEHPHSIDLLVADVIMPDMNGRKLSERLQALRPGLRTVFISGYTSNVIAHHGVLDEGVDFLEKPFTRQALLARVRSVLGAARKGA